MIKRPTEVYCCEECMKEKKEEEMSDERQETISDIVADIRAQNQGLPEDSYALSPLVCDLLSIADRIEAAHKRELESGSEEDCHQPVTDCHGLNAAAMYEALVMVNRLFDGRLMWQPDIRKAHEAVNAALAASPRNCDVGTAEKQEERFFKFCTPKKCNECKLHTDESFYGCVIRWEQMPYEEGCQPGFCNYYERDKESKVK